MVWGRRTLALGAAVLAVGFAGCGSDDTEPDEYAAALAPSLFPADDNGVDDDARRCVASEVVAAVGGPSTLDELGITPDELADADDLTALGLDIGPTEAEAVAESLEPCGVSVVDLLVAELDLPPQTRRCVEDNLDPGALRAFIVTTIVDESADAAATDAVVEPIVRCFPD